MTPSRVIRIFLASSITELKKERDKLGEYLAGADIQNMFLHDNVIIQLVRCEDIYSGSDGEKPQEILNQRLRDCEMSVFLFKTKAGKRTREEFDVAKTLQKSGKHTMCVYCMNVQDEERSEDLKRFIKRLDDEGPDWESFDDVGDVKASFIRSLLIYEHKLLVKLGERYEASAKSTQFWSVVERTEKTGEDYLKKYEFHDAHKAQSQKEVHQAIDDLMLQVGTIMEDSSKSIADKIYSTHEIYQKANLWASKTDYDKEKYIHLLNSYAEFLYKYGLYRDAELVYTRQINLSEELYGTKHSITATSYNCLGVVYREKGDYERALEYYNKAKEIREDLYGTNHPSTATSYNNIGLIYTEKGDYDQALNYLQKACNIREKELGKNHPDTAVSYNNIGLVLDEKGYYNQALELYQKACEIFEKEYGKEHPYTGKAARV